MSIAILYESKEWSNTHLAELIIQKGVDCQLIDMEDCCPTAIIQSELYVNRVFPSAFIREHHHAVENTFRFLNHLDRNGVPVINNSQVFHYDCSKDSYYRVLADQGITIPPWIQTNPQKNHEEARYWGTFPAIVKLDCGGRSYKTEIFKDKSGLLKWTPAISDVHWIVQAYEEPAEGFITRVEIVGKEIIGVFKRSLGKKGLSSYSRGSRYSQYPDCSEKLLQQAEKAMNLLAIEMAGLDFIEDGSGGGHLIDINPSSNFSPDLNPLYGFDPIEKMAAYILKRYEILTFF